MTTTVRVPAHTVTDLTTTLARLRLARTMHDHTEIKVSENRLNWLLDKLPRKAPP